MIRTALAFGVLLASIAGARPATAQTPDDHWQWTVAPYLMGASMDGTVAVRGNEAVVDLSASDIFDHMDLGFMAMASARKGNWGLVGDFIWADLGVERPHVEIDQRLGILTLQGLRRLCPFGDLTFGARWNHVSGGLDLTGAPPEVEESRDWVDPVVGLVLRTPGEGRWHATLIADIGGFGVSSDLAWQLFPTVGVNLTQRGSLEFGWRWLDTDYDVDKGGERFAWNVLLQGPVVGYVFRF